VAKNMTADFFRPLLRAHPVLLYDYRNWGNNYVWLHKQPLFLWQMALSMKLLGANVLALRLPSVVLSTLAIYPVYRIGRLLSSPLTGYLAAILATFSYYTLELTSGAMSLDHNDVAFVSYVTASIWAYYEYRHATRRWGWLLAVGLFAGCAVLCKWLTGLLVYGGWALDILNNAQRRRDVAEYARLMLSAGVAAVVFLPWQLYIHRRFPLESTYEAYYTKQHLFRAIEGNAGDWTFHFQRLQWQLGTKLLVLMLLGVVFALQQRNRKAFIPALGICVVVMLFFTLVATKMPSFTYINSCFWFVFAALPVALALKWLANNVRGWPGAVAAHALFVGLLWIDARPLMLRSAHVRDEYDSPLLGIQHRVIRIANARLYQQLRTTTPPNCIIFNANDDDDIEAMFYSDRAVYSQLPKQAEWEILRRQHLPLAVYAARAGQIIPTYITQTPGLLLLPQAPQAIPVNP
jgi:4-amino-4-deoxy-L-arabinose transferase-like glycosyltransferase